MAPAKDFLIREFEIGNCEDITSNPRPDFDKPFFNSIAGLMERFTKQEATAFAEWLDSFGWRQFQESTWYNTVSHKHRATDYYTTGQLYQQFKKDQE